jgi:hypothetical protein
MTDRLRITTLALAAVLAACGAVPSAIAEQEITVTEQTEPTAPATTSEPTPLDPSTPDSGPPRTRIPEDESVTTVPGQGDADLWSGAGYTISLPAGMVAAESGELASGMHELVSYQLIGEDVGPISMISSVTDPSDTSLATLVRYSALLDSLSAQAEVVELSRFGLDVHGADERAEAGEYVTGGVERRLLMTVQLADERILSFMATCLEAQVDACRPMLTSILDSVEVTR